MIFALALLLTCCGKVTNQQQGHQAPSGGASPSPIEQVAVKNGGAAAEAPNPTEAERVYVFSYQGDMDRPVYPTLIGSSQKAIDGFLAAHSKDQLLPDGPHVLTTADGLVCITDALKTAETKSTSDKDANAEQRKSYPRLMVTEWSASKERAIEFSATSGLELLNTTEACLKKSDAKPAGSLDALIVLLSR